MRRWHAATDPTDARADTRSPSVPKSCVRSGNYATRDPRNPGSRVSSVASPKPDTPLEVAATSPRAPGRPRGGFAVIDWDRGARCTPRERPSPSWGPPWSDPSVRARVQPSHSWSRDALSAVRESHVPDGRRPDGRVVPLLSLVEGGAPRTARRSPEQILTDYLELFDKQLREGKVRADSAADLERCIRLLSHVRTGAGSVEGSDERDHAFRACSGVIGSSGSTFEPPWTTPYAVCWASACRQPLTRNVLARVTADTNEMTMGSSVLSRHPR